MTRTKTARVTVMLPRELLAAPLIRLDTFIEPARPQYMREVEWAIHRALGLS